jgi:hypothetical protein
VHSGRFPGLYLIITGTPAFYDGPQGVQRLAPLAQRLATDFPVNPRFDNPRAVQLRLPGFTLDLLTELGGRVRDLYADGSTEAGRVRSAVEIILPSRQPTPTSQVAGRIQPPVNASDQRDTLRPIGLQWGSDRPQDLRDPVHPDVVLFSPMTRTRRASGGGGRLRVTGCQCGIGGEGTARASLR